VFLNRAPLVARHKKGVSRQRDSSGVVHPGDKIGVDRGSGGGVVFANPAGSHHQEVVSRQSDPIGKAGQAGNEVSVDRGSRNGVVFTNRVAGLIDHEEVVSRQREPVGVAQSCDEVGVDRGSGGGVVFANRASAETDLTDI
jgi:hypothetical protein